MGETLLLIGSSILGAGASAGVATAVGGLVTAGVFTGAAALTGAFDSPDISQPAALSTPIDKTTAELQDELDAPLIGDEKSRKKKAAASKSQFKVELDTESGINIQDTQKVTGVQL